MVWDVTPQEEVGASPPQLALQHSHSEALAAQEPDWDKEQELYQAVLLKGHQVLLTTFHRSDNNSIDQVNIPMVPLGRVWDYSVQDPNTTWLAEVRATTNKQRPKLAEPDLHRCMVRGPVHRQICKRLNSAVLHGRLPHGLPPARNWAARHNDLPTALCLGRCPMSHRGLGHHLE
jgi:hypothetical protein